MMARAAVSWAHDLRRSSDAGCVPLAPPVRGRYGAGMTRAAIASMGFGIYVVLIGAVLVIAPNLLLTAFGWQVFGLVVRILVEPGQEVAASRAAAAAAG